MPIRKPFGKSPVYPCASHPPDLMEHHLDPHDASQTQPAAQVAMAEAIWAVLSRLTDPEIPVVSLRDMGILRDVRRVGSQWQVVITPTYSGCPAMGQIEDDVRQA